MKMQYGEAGLGGFKSMLASKTIWGALVAGGGTLLNLFGYTIGEADQMILTNAIGEMMTIGGSAVAIWGRVAATKQIG